MTGNERPWLWSLPTRVELAEGAVIQFPSPNGSVVEFSQAKIDKMFEFGLMQSPNTTDGRSDARADVTLTGNARFLVGALDLGREVGLEVLARGLNIAADLAVREDRDRQPRSDIADDEVGDESVPYEPHDREPAGTREIQIPIDQAGDQLPDLLAALGRGARVVLVDRGARIAVLMAWSSYAALREQLAAASVAFWTAWRTGVFDVAGYATDIITVLHRPGTKSDPNPGEDEAGTAKGHDGDERIR